MVWMYRGKEGQTGRMVEPESLEEENYNLQRKLD